jgi:hypothetical protein
LDFWGSFGGDKGWPRGGLSNLEICDVGLEQWERGEGKGLCGGLGFKIGMRGGFGLESMATIAEWLLVCLVPVHAVWCL